VRDGRLYGRGGTIPFMNMLSEKFPDTQFLVTGVLGPHSKNAVRHRGAAQPSPVTARDGRHWRRCQPSRPCSVLLANRGGQPHGRHRDWYPAPERPDPAGALRPAVPSTARTRRFPATAPARNRRLHVPLCGVPHRQMTRSGERFIDMARCRDRLIRRQLPRREDETVHGLPEFSSQDHPKVANFDDCCGFSGL
jgi:hypothetical protein